MDTRLNILSRSLIALRIRNLLKKIERNKYSSDSDQVLDQVRIMKYLGPLSYQK